MKTIHRFLGLTLMLGTLETHAQPQWRFHLAFEDATGAKDTIWFIYDTTATGGHDIHLGGGFVPVDPDAFNVWMSTTLTGGTAIKTVSLPYSAFPEGYFPMEGGGYTPPLTIRWDTMLFHAPYLPSTPTSYIRHPRLCGYQIGYHGLSTWPGGDCYSMFLSDSLVFVAPPLEDVLYLHMVFGYDNPDITGISEPSIPSLEIFPNPTQSRVMLIAPVPLTEILLLDAVGRAVLRVAPPGLGPVEVDVSGLPAGSYFVHARGRAGMYRGRVVVE